MGWQGGSRALSWPAGKCAWIAACIAGGMLLLTVSVAMPLVRRNVLIDLEARWEWLGFWIWIRWS